METREQYEAAFGQLQTPEEQEQFIQKYGNAENYPTQAEKAVTLRPGDEGWIDTSNEEMIPVTADSPTPDFLPEEAEPATEEEMAQNAQYERENLQAMRAGELARKEEEEMLRYAELDANGEPLRDWEGDIVRRDVSAFEKMGESIANIGSQLKAAVPSINLGAGVIWEKILGEEAIEAIVNNPDIDDFWKVGLSQKSIEENLHAKRMAEAEMGETGSITKGIQEGDIGEIAAGIVNGITSIGSSAVVNTLTLGGGLPVQFAGDFYADYNEEIAKEKGKSLEDLIADGEDEIDAPLAFGMLAGLSERFGIKGAGKAITSRIKGPLAKKVAHRLLSGNKEGLTELFQTGLEGANTAHAKGEDATEAFTEQVFSQDGLESYLQGFVGGATMAGKGQNERENIKKLQKVANSMRAPIDAAKVEELLEKESELVTRKKGTTNPLVLEGINNELKEVQSQMKNIIPKANGIVQRMTDQEIDKAETLADAARAVNAKYSALSQQFQEGIITEEEYNDAREGYKTEFLKKKEQLGKIKAEAEGRQPIREKDLTTLKPRSQWSKVTAPVINEIAQNNIKDGKLTEKGIWDILQTKQVGDVVKAAISKRFAAQGQEYDATAAQELESELLYGGKQSIHGLLKSWDSSKGANPASYIYGQIQNKLTGKLSKLEDKANRQAKRIDQMTEEGRHQIQIADEAEFEQAETTRRTTAEQAARLGLSPQAADTVKSQMQTLVADGVVNPSDKKFESKYVDRFRKFLLPTVKKELGRKREDFKNYLDQNASELISIYPKRTLAKKRNDPAQAWAERTPSAQEFIDYHYPVKEDGTLDEGLMAKRKTRLAEAISEGLGFRAMEDTLVEQQETSTRDKINAGFDKVIETLRSLQGERGTLQSNPLAIPLNMLEGATIVAKKAFNAGADFTNAVKEAQKYLKDNGIQKGLKELKDYFSDFIGYDQQTWQDKQNEVIEQEKINAAKAIQIDIDPDSFFTQFQEDNQASDNDMTRIAADYDTILERFGIKGGAVTAKTDRAGLQDWAANTLTKYLPKEFFATKNVAGAKGPDRYFIWDNAVEMNKSLEGKEFGPDGGIDWKLVGKVEFKEVANDPNRLAAKVKKNAAREKANMDALEFLAKQIEKMVQDDPQNARYAAGLLMNFQNSQGGIIRAAAPMKGTSLEGAKSGSKKVHGKMFVEEHTMPQNVVAKYILSSALDKNSKMEDAFKNVRRNFFQIMLNTDDDLKLIGKETYKTKTGLVKERTTFNYGPNMPDGWKMSDNVWARYFNNNVNNNNGGINPNGIYLFEEGKTIAQIYGAKVDPMAGMSPELRKYFSTPKRIGAEFGLPAGKRIGAEFVHNPLVKLQKQVVAEQVGDKFENFIDTAINSMEKLAGPKGALQANIAAVPLNVIVGGLRATKLAYRGARDLAAAIEAGYQLVKDYMSRQEWADFTSKAIKEVKNEKTPAQKFLAVANKQAVQNEKKRQQFIQRARKAGIEVSDDASESDVVSKLSKKAKEDAAQIKKNENTRSEFDNILEKKKVTRLGRFANKYLLGYEAEDFKGLLYSMTPNTKDGFKWFEDNLINPYTEGVEAFKAWKSGNESIFRKAAETFGRKNVLNTPASDLKDDNAPENIKAFANELKKIDDGEFFKNLNDDTDIASQMTDYMRKVKRKEFINNFIENADSAFYQDGKIRKEIVDKLGEGYASALDNVLTRMKSGVNRMQYTSGNKEAQRVLDLINESNSIIMQWNMRSGFLQMISAFNYFRAAGIESLKPSNLKYANEIWNSSYMKERWGTSGFALEADEIVRSKKKSWVGRKYQALIKAGFLPTKAMDALAISVGGAGYYAAMLNKHNGDKDLAMRDFVKFTEENQQSSDPSKISKLQAGSLGRLAFAFLNTPFQYMRLTKRAAQDIKAGRGSFPDNALKIGYYTVVQSAIFSMLQQMFNVNDLMNWFDDEEDEEDFKVGLAIDGWINTNLKTLGQYGALASWVRDIYKEYDKQKEEGKPDPAKLAIAATKISPPISRKLTDLQNIAKTNYRQNQGKLDQQLKALALAGDVINLPTYRAYQKIENLAALADEDRTAWDKFWKMMGYSDFALSRKKEDDEFSDVEWDDASFDDLEGVEWDDDTPIQRLKKGEAGQAHNDGTIEVDPNLSPEEKRKTIAHEKQHVKDMKENGLDYDDKNVYWKGESYARKNGKIKEGNTWKKEGDPSLPWEKRAYAAENGSPIKKDKPKPGTPEWDKHVQEGVQYNRDWYNEPGTRAMLEEQAPRFKGKVDKYLDRMGEVHFDHAPHLEAGEVAEFYRNPYAEEGEHEFNVGIGPDHSVDRPGLVAHELSHAAGWDYDLGKKVLDVTGGPDKSTRYGRYLSSPDEAYGNLQELRHILDLKPTQRDLTPDQLQKLIDEKGNDDVKAYVKAFGLENVTKAHNQVAANDKKLKKRSLEDLYNNKQNDYYV